MSIWDDPAFKVGGNFVSFDKEGDTVTGIVTGIRTHDFGDGKVVPQIFLKTEDGEERTMTVGQIRLRAALAEQRPDVGDRLTVTLTQLEPKGGKKILKHFDVKIERGEKPPF